MKKLFYILLISFMICMSSCSFETYATTQDDIYTEYVEDIVYSNVDMNIVIRYGRPYYYNGSILYYLYNNIYYYPYYYNNYWYMRAYRRPFAHIHYHPYFRPHRYDYRFSSGYHRPHNWYRYTPSTRRHDYRPRPNVGRPNVGRPNVGRPNNHTQSFPQRGGSTITRPNTNSRPMGGNRPSTLGGNRPSTFGGGSRGTRGGR